MTVRDSDYTLGGRWDDRQMADNGRTAGQQDDSRMVVRREDGRTTGGWQDDGRTVGRQEDGRTTGGHRDDGRAAG